MGGHRSKSGLFLMELMMAILFFAIASAVCIQLFARAQMLSRGSVNETNASLKAQSVAETFKACDGEIHWTSNAVDGFYNDVMGTIVLFYNEDWQQVSIDENAAYTLELRKDMDREPYNIDDKMSTATITVYEGDRAPIFEITVKHYSIS